MRQELEFLNSRVIDESISSLEDIGDFTIYLSTTNAIADSVNSQKLSVLDEDEMKFKGNIAGAVEGFQFPAEYELKLKKGAQVMLLSNDKQNRWVNGTVGKFMGVYDARKSGKKTSGYSFGGDGLENFGEKPETDMLMIDLENGERLFVGKNKWDVIDYLWDENSNEIETDVIGAYTQYPVKLAWATTIHKSQGKTFDKVVIDMGRGAFAHGQLYVALSRCRTLEGIQLVKPASLNDIRMDERVLDFLIYCRDQGQNGEKQIMYLPGGLF